MSNQCVTPADQKAQSLMSRFKLSKIFEARDDEDGAVTVDFIVITAAIVILGTVVVNLTRGGQEKIAGDIDTSLSATPVSQ